MSQISPPIRILLVCAVAFMAAWMLFLRPSSDAGAPAAETPPVTTPVEAGGEQADSLAGKAVEQANESQAAADARVERIENGTETAADANAAANAQGSESASATGSAQPNTAKAAGKAGAKAAAKSGLPLRVLKAIGDHKVVVLLFWSPKSADDKAVRKALAGIDRHDGKVLAHATHLKRISRYSQITRGANVQQSPTVLVIDRKLRVVPLVGYVDRVTIDQAVTDALRASK
jgi:hypothetical protein